MTSTEGEGQKKLPPPDQAECNPAAPESEQTKAEKPKGTLAHSQNGRASSSPVMTNTNRPPSVNSTHSVGSGSAVRTTTSRRGGRIRSRSPPAMTNRPPGEQQFPAGPTTDAASQSPANPSSAAAAAAEAAKALSNRGGRQSKPGWNESGRGPQHGEHPRYHGGYDNSTYGGAQAWPGDDTQGRHQQALHRGRPFEQDPRAYGDPHHHSKRRNLDQHIRYDGRAPYEGGQYGPGGHGGAPGPCVQDYNYYNAPSGMSPMNQNPLRDGSAMHLPFQSPMRTPGGPDAETTSTVKRKGGTTRVIGTPTPIHVPRAADPPSSQYSDQQASFTPQGSAASVFRGRPNGATGGDEPQKASDDDTPQRILLSLRTPTSSFEDQNRSSSSKSRSAPPLSPEEPPKIQHAHHQNRSSDQPLIFEPHRSPRSQSGSGLEMAGSFNLFNHSFDSLGEAANYLMPLDTAFQSHSFGAGPTGSGDNDTPVPLPAPIDKDASFGGAKGGLNGQQLLGGSSSGGTLTFGMSPVNSFGNDLAGNQQRRRSNMMLLGGTDDAREQSPTQVLGMYPSYSGGYGNQPALQAPFRTRTGAVMDGRPLASASFGPVMAQTYTRSCEQGPRQAMPVVGVFSGQMAPSASQEGALAFYPFLNRNRAAFIKCSFLLPGLKAALLESPLSEHNQSVQSGESSRGNGTGSLGRQLSIPPGLDGAMMSCGARKYLEPTPQDTAIAMRRIISSVCAFGGSIIGDRSAPAQDSRGKDGSGPSSIFRVKGDGQHATVTPSSSSGTPPGNRGSRSKYDELLPTRYYENENRLSWEFEENPPIDDGGSGNRNDDEYRQGAGDDPSYSGPVLSPEELKALDEAEGDKKPGSPDQPKMRYRCKLCGLPKQNHTCPYQQSLQRSIGTMIYPAVNAFTSNEPGMLAPALTEMNNFILSGSESMSSPDTSPGRPSPVRHNAPRATSPKGKGASANVTPETQRSTTQTTSPGYLSTSPGSAGTPLRTPRSAKRKKARPGTATVSGGPIRVGSSPTNTSGGIRKRPHSQMTEDQSNDLLFVDAVDLKPEQFRIISPSCNTSRPGAYTYPSLPLPYAQRKRLSDNLFALSKEVPELTDECAVVLREAREKDMWDLAVAELMTQVVIVIHCHEADTRMEGLRQYLLTLGIAC